MFLHLLIHLTVMNGSVPKTQPPISGDEAQIFSSCNVINVAPIHSKYASICQISWSKDFVKVFKNIELLRAFVYVR